ncbi:MAG TPA: hypothetical protein VKH41_10900 [Myxococcota bacterium]|nr:hypothetical protein [Myxococcota bacterium]
MSARSALGFTAIAALLLAAPAPAQEPEEAGARAEGAEDLKLEWSLTPIATWNWVNSDDEGHDHVTGFFDQYEFVPNKGSAFPFEIGVRDASLDLLAPGDTPRLRFRLESPSSNLGVSGSEIADPFFNQRALLLGRVPGVDVDVSYRRMRTEDLRVFPNTVDGLLFDDRSGPHRRFNWDRTGVGGEVRTRVDELLESADLRKMGSPELSLRGGYEARQGDRQLRFLIDPTNQWIGLAQDHDQKVANVGGGVLAAPGGLFTLGFGFDYQRFRDSETPILQGMLGGAVPATANTIGFVPDTDRYTSTARFRSLLGQRAVIEGGLQLSLLEQAGNFTPLEEQAGLDTNRLYYYSGNVTADVALVGALSANAFFKFDQRDNRIDRHTALFNTENGTQVDEFIHRWQRIHSGIEGVYRFDAGNLAALGGRVDWIDRDRDFVFPFCPALPCNAAILPVNSLVQDDSQSYTVYARTQLRPLRRVGVSGELGYRTAPDIAYVTDLDDYAYGRLRASWTLPVERSVVVSLTARGGHGHNRGQEMVGGGGVGTPPAGPDLRRHFDRLDWLVGLTANAQPWDRVGLFASSFVSQDAQDYELALSSLQRYVQPFAPVTFRNAGDTDYRDEHWSVVVGTHVQIDPLTDATASGSFTRGSSHYSAGGSPELDLVDRYSKIDSDVYGADLEVGRWIVEGLRVLVAYRFQYYLDGTNLYPSVQSSIQPFDPTNIRHTVTLGVTLTSALGQQKPAKSSGMRSLRSPEFAHE